MAALRPFTDEQARTLVNLRQRHEVWRDAERAWRKLEAGIPAELKAAWNEWRAALN